MMATVLWHISNAVIGGIVIVYEQMMGHTYWCAYLTCLWDNCHTTQSADKLVSLDKITFSDFGKIKKQLRVYSEKLLENPCSVDKIQGKQIGPWSTLIWPNITIGVNVVFEEAVALKRVRYIVGSMRVII